MCVFKPKAPTSEGPDIIPEESVRIAVERGSLRKKRGIRFRGPPLASGECPEDHNILARMIFPEPDGPRINVFRQKDPK